jgi:hypothetical protein
MKKKDRSPEKPQSSPNPRPCRRNKKQREPTAKAKKKESPVGTPITTPINSPERSPIVNSFSALQTDSDAEEEKSTDTINAEEVPVELKSDISDEHEHVSEALVASLTKSNTSDTPEELKRSNPTGPIAEILPTDLERLKESVPIFALQLATVAGQLFPEETYQPTHSERNASVSIVNGRQFKMKPPPAASLPLEASSPCMPDKNENSLYFNSGKRPASFPMIHEDSKLPAVEIPTKQNIKHSQQRIQSNLITT